MIFRSLDIRRLFVFFSRSPLAATGKSVRKPGLTSWLRGFGRGYRFRARLPRDREIFVASIGWWGGGDFVYVGIAMCWGGRIRTGLGHSFFFVLTKATTPAADVAEIEPMRR